MPIESNGVINLSYQELRVYSWQRPFEVFLDKGAATTDLVCYHHLKRTSAVPRDSLVESWRTRYCNAEEIQRAVPCSFTFECKVTYSDQRAMQRVNRFGRLTLACLTSDEQIEGVWEESKGRCGGAEVPGYPNGRVQLLVPMPQQAVRSAALTMMAPREFVAARIVPGAGRSN